MKGVACAPIVRMQSTLEVPVNANCISSTRSVKVPARLMTATYLPVGPKVFLMLKDCPPKRSLAVKVAFEVVVIWR